MRIEEYLEGMRRTEGGIEVEMKSSVGKARRLW